MFPDNLFISDPTSGMTYVVENDVVSKSFPTHIDVYGYLIAQNMQEVYTVNRTSNSITRYKNLQAIGDIPVGKTPWGICEDPTGKIYVSNYADNTVSIIQDGVVVSRLSVDKGPKGIISDPNGIVYVACYISNTICKIMNNVLVDRIKVPSNPEGITCSPTGEIWATCSGSNVVVKLLKNGNHLTIDTGKSPVAVVCDKKGNVFTANFEDDTVSQISTVNKNQVTTIAVGDGPSAIAVNSQGMVYVTSNLSGEKIYKINPKSAVVIDKIEVCKGQSAFGDFTGCATFNCFNPTGSVSGSISTEAVSDVVKALKPTFSVTSFEENSDGSYAIKLTSDSFDLAKFDHLTLNGTNVVDANGAYVLTAEEIGTQLSLVGYFASEDTAPVTFVSIPISKVFNVVIGVVDENWSNWIELKRTVVDFTKQDVTSIVVNQNVKGHLLMYVPIRAFDAVKDGIVVQGMQDIATAWASDASDEEAADANNNIEATVPANLTNKYTKLQNWNVTNANQKFFFQFFKIG